MLAYPFVKQITIIFIVIGGGFLDIRWANCLKGKPLRRTHKYYLDIHFLTFWG